MALYEKQHNDSTLVAWLRDYAEEGPARRARVVEAREGMKVGLEGLERSLANASWLSGDNYGLADVSWVVNANRLNQAGVDLSEWPRFVDWSERAMARPAFGRAVANYSP